MGLLWLAACSCNVAQLMSVTMRGSIIAAIPMKEVHFGLVTSLFTWVNGADLNTPEISRCSNCRDSGWVSLQRQTGRYFPLWITQGNRYEPG